MTRVVGRSALLAQVADLLARGESVALCGPTGVGRSALLDVLHETAGGALVLRCHGSAEEQVLPFAALRDLLAQAPAHDLDLDAHIGRGDRAGLAAACHRLFGSWAGDRTVLLLLDDVQWLDAESSAVVGYVRRRLSGQLRVVVTLGEGEADHVDVSDLHHLDVPPLDAGDLVDLLCGLGLAPDVAQRISVESGQMPSTALALAGAIGQRPAVLGSPTPVPPSIAHVWGERVRLLPADVRETLVHAALLHRPTVRQLERGGRIAAREHVRRAARAGLLAGPDRDGGALRFTPSLLRAIVTDQVPAERRADLHQALAETASTSPERLRHLALSDPRPSAELAHELADSARDAAARGSRDLAAELFLLAADRAPATLADEQVPWLVAAVETAAPGNHVDLVRRALAQAFDEHQPDPGQRVRLRLAIPELAGNGVALLDEVLAAALADAGDDDSLVASVLLQRARIALMESRPRASQEAAERAVELLERRTGPGADGAIALALTTLVVSRRWLGREHGGDLARAVRLADPAPTGFLHISPAYMAARFAFYDDRLEEAWCAFLTMLGRVERGAGMDHVHVLRCLVEVAARMGRCAEAATYAARAAAVGAEFDLDAHTGWFIAAQAELLTGDLGRARTLALRGVEAAEAAGDVRYVQRHLILLGQALLRAGDAQGAVAALLRVRAIEADGGFGDPTVNRWHADLVCALVALARLDEAAERLAEARYAVERRLAHGGTAGVSASLDRAEAELALARGDLDAADLLLERAAKVAGDLGLLVELGRIAHDAGARRAAPPAHGRVAGHAPGGGGALRRARCERVVGPGAGRAQAGPPRRGRARAGR